MPSIAEFAQDHVGRYMVPDLVRRTLQEFGVSLAPDAIWWSQHRHNELLLLDGPEPVVLLVENAWLRQPFHSHRAVRAALQEAAEALKARRSGPKTVPRTRLAT